MKQRHFLQTSLLAVTSWTLFASVAHSQALNSIQGQTNGPTYVPGEILIKFKDNATEAQLQDVTRRAGVTSLSHIQTRAMKDKGDKGITRVGTQQPVLQALQALEKHPGIDYAQPNWIYRHQAVVNDTYYNNGSLWGMYGAATTPANAYGSGAATAWDNPVSAETVYIGIIDEGIQYHHPDLAANIWTNPLEVAGDLIDNDGNGYLNDIYGWNAINNNGTIYSATYDDHGTHVAGTIGAVANSTGVIGVIGNQNVKFISGKFLGPNGGTTADAIEVIDYMIALKTHNGLNIAALNNSWGGGGSDPALFAAIVRAAKQEILFVVASGNDGIDTAITPAYPACYNTTVRPPGASSSTEVASYNSVISVTAIDSAGAIASWANYGAGTIDLGAPGVNILSTLNQSTYGYYSGTSMATPHVAGAIALYESKYPGTAAADVRTALLNSTTATPSLAGKTVTGGRLNIEAFLQPPPVTAPSAPTLLKVTGIAATEVTLAWTDTSDNEANFRIRRTDGSPNDPVFLTVGANVTTYADTGLIPGTTYTYTMEACNQIGCTPEPETDPIATATTPVIPRALATFKRTDTTTKGSWVGNYGTQSYDIIGYKYVPPTGITLASTGATTTWAASTTDLRALQTPDKASRAARCYFSSPAYTPGSFFTIDVNLTDGQTHKVSLYCLDWDTTARNQLVEVVDYNYKDVINTVSLPNSFNGGQYLVWEISGHVTLKVSLVSGANAVVSGIFIDDPNYVPPAPPVAPGGLTATAISRSQINLAWVDNSGNESGFTIERSKSATTGFVQVASVAANVTGYPNTGLSRNTTYYYRIRSFNASGSSAYSSTVSAKTFK